ncbi:Wzz/FepE/Etk N-terminal domain-containing protein [Curvibacter sp. HBC61]|uniref:Wzz/FepE/Etk N-terminal domain-containing protein n=1 Tax=Curvibacter cyanobacteriorum TaxID=3026422 RepID=A0ABT5MSY9_9BURK|nr:Wzz/FepE/Etk N-terminal domain-containing protein [Curvibacter sp. HBC61]MDD0837164.1 Wzz/FepE/Etk N-terminal domain-containing protein [Curvibacter sp. HBC61]
MNHFPVGLTLNQLGAMLKFRLPTIFLVTLVTMLATATAVLLIPKTYTSSAELFIEYRVNDPISGRQFPAMLDESYLLTQVDIIRSNEVIDRVIDTLRLMDKPGAEKSRQLLRERLSKNIEIQLRRSSRIVELQYSDLSSEGARDFLDALIKAYMDINVEISVAPARARLEQYNAQLKLLREEIDGIQNKLTEYQQKAQIVDTDERLDNRSRQLGELSTKQLLLRTQRQEFEARMRALDVMINSGNEVPEVPEIAQQPRVAELKLRLSDLERRIGDLSATYGKMHPKLVALQDERAVLVERLKREAKAALQGIRLEGMRLADQERALGRSMDEQQRSVLEAKRHRDVISSYQRQLESAQRVYNTAVAKYDEILMLGTVNGTSLSVLRKAEAPLKHAKPQITKSVLMSILVGLVLGLGLSFLLEIAVRRLRCLEDMERGLGLRLFGQIGKSTV